MANTRDALRGKIFSAENRKPRTETIDMLGAEVEVRQPTIGQITKLAGDKSEISPLYRIMIEYCYAPGTDVKMFTNADVAALSELPSGPWLSNFNKAIERLTGIDVKGAEKNSEATPSA